MKSPRLILPLLIALALAGCATRDLPPAAAKLHPVAVRHLRTAQQKTQSTEERAAHYLAAAAATAPLFDADPARAEAARKIYNQAVADLTVLLRSGDDGRLWNRPTTLTYEGATYRLRFAPGVGRGLWKPDEFTTIVPASEVREKTIKHPTRQDGVGGALVGVRNKTPREPFAPRVGVTAAVTATLEFQGRDATLTLRDPGEVPTARVAGRERPLHADFSAPLAYYPAVNELFAGLMGALRVNDYMSTTGLYLLQPYDPDRIPLIFVHGLISTPQMWRNVINEIEKDPILRGRFQCWVFAYPTGNPVAYSSLRLREELEEARQRFGWPHGFVLVSHSMGGILSRMQAVTLDRAAWDRHASSVAEKVIMGLPSDNLIHRALIFDANPNVRRIVFICTPHRGSDMATGGIGALAMRLIALPATLSATISSSVGNTLSAFTGGAERMPNSITSLSPKNPTLKVVDSVPLRAPHHTILGDRGKGNSPNSSDGVVPYWSSHLASAQSQKIVPGPHGSCELLQTIEELRRILHLHLKTAAH